MAYSVRVDPQMCIGTTQCVETAPGVYDMNAAHTMAVVKNRKAADAELLAGAKSCPVAAIIVTDDETGQQIYP